ncbi:uncharacterized protein K460DRAFT_275350 [Cucurbitaria berberidis CBS 394.84]|uniref:Uncharacterized protein n=1 Tax=Cucurbitaria berberidis CBS 394.84 TaxID=1168544 RepID=A0A9P4GN51_9PLEO|nr:uncharacterized protein K460DRAFT_275350 [Cucurbitaria berberidis CBS 394.84]KAF1848717.1 hypothetical protein K460DRAFT_275350 [Cucurbitaria berberidis CBS 394.84]
MGRIEAWNDDTAYHLELADAATARSITTEVYEDWLNWARSYALAWLGILDKYELRFRATGLKYHKIPFSLRHSATLLHGSKIDQSVLTRLTQIFETDRPRKLQSYFTPWMEINKIATETLAEIDNYRPGFGDLDFLCAMNRRLDLSFAMLIKPLNILRVGLHWVENTVALVAERSPLDCCDVLAAKHSLEGSVFRRWIQTFWEIDSGTVRAAAYTEYYVGRVLATGVGTGKYWSTMLESRSRAEDSLMRLKAAFETCRIEEYQAIFAPLSALIQRASDLRSDAMHSSLHGTVVQRYHHLMHEVVPTMYHLLQEIVQEREKFLTLNDNANSLDHISQVFRGSAESDHRYAWLDAYYTHGERFIPAHMLEEWNTLRAWVWSLPETQRVVTAGYRSLDEVTLEMVFSEEEEEEEELTN